MKKNLRELLTTQTDDAARRSPADKGWVYTTGLDGPIAIWSPISNFVRLHLL